MRRLHHMSICYEGVVYLVVMGFILTAAVIRQINLLMILYGLLAGPLLLSWRLVRWTLKRVDVSRRAPKSVFAGEPFTVDVTVANGRRRGGSFSITVTDELRRRGAAAAAATADVYFSYVPAGQSRRASYRGTLSQRGLYDFQPLKASTRFPLGLLRTMLRFDKPARLAVYPALGRLSPAWQRLLRLEDPSSLRLRARRVGAEGDFYGLRDWRPGDGRTRVHWRTSARRQALTVRQYERRRHAGFALFVELWQPKQPTPADLARVEEAASFAATLLAEASRQGREPPTVEILAKTPRRLRAAGSATTLDESLRALAAAEATSEDRIVGALATAVAELRPTTNVVVVSSRPLDLADGERFPAIQNSPELRHRLSQIVCLSPDDLLWRELYQPGSER